VVGEGEVKLIIAGSRTVHPTPAEIDAALAATGWLLFAGSGAEVVSGTATGADQAGEAWAVARSVQIKRFPADWERHGKAAGKLRNRTMAEYADMAIVFWDGMSTGSCDMVTRMVARDKPVRVVPMKGVRR
jgi:hypothetical protein